MKVFGKVGDQNQGYQGHMESLNSRECERGGGGNVSHFQTPQSNFLTLIIPNIINNYSFQGNQKKPSLTPSQKKIFIKRGGWSW